MTFDYIDVPEGINTDLEVPAGGAGKRRVGIDLAFLYERSKFMEHVLNGKRPEQVSISLAPMAAEWNGARSGLGVIGDRHCKNERYSDDWLIHRYNSVLSGDPMIWATDAKPSFDFCAECKHVERDHNYIQKYNVGVEDETMLFCVGYGSSKIEVQPFVDFHKIKSGTVAYRAFSYYDYNRRFYIRFSDSSLSGMRYKINWYARLVVDFAWSVRNYRSTLAGANADGSGQYISNLYVDDFGVCTVDLEKPISYFINSGTMHYSTFIEGFPQWALVNDSEYWGTFKINDQVFTADGGEVEFTTSVRVDVGLDIPQVLLV